MTDSDSCTSGTNHLFAVQMSGRAVWTEDYSLAYEYATGRRVEGEYTVDEATGEDRISILHDRYSEPGADGGGNDEH